MRQGCLPVPLPFIIVLDVLAQTVREEKKKDSSIVDEKLSLSIGNIIVYTNKTVLESKRSVVELRKSSKVAGSVISAQK